MSVYKEGYYIIDQIQKRSKQIWNDACDYGALTQVGDELWNMVKQLIEWYGLPETRTKVDYGSNHQHLKVIVELMDEWDTGRIEPFKITYTTIKCKVNGTYWDGYFEVEKKPTMWILTKQNDTIREPEKMNCGCGDKPYCEIHGWPDQTLEDKQVYKVKNNKVVKREPEKMKCTCQVGSSYNNLTCEMHGVEREERMS